MAYALDMLVITGALHCPHRFVLVIVLGWSTPHTSSGEMRERDESWNEYSRNVYNARGQKGSTDVQKDWWSQSRLKEDDYSCGCGCGLYGGRADAGRGGSVLGRCLVLDQRITGDECV